MAAIVIVTSEIAGRVQVSFELAKRLTAAGHTVKVASPDDISDRAAKLGGEFLTLGPGRTEVAQSSTPAAGGRLTALVKRLAAVRSAKGQRAAKVDALGLDAISDQLAHLEPDLMLVDIELPTVVMASAGAGHPTAVWTTMMSIIKLPSVPPLGSDIVPGVGVRGSRVGIEIEWLRFRVGKWVKATRQRITRTGLDQLSVMREVARRTGFPLEDTDRFQWLVPFVYPSLPTLTFTAAAFEFPSPAPGTVRYVGPVIDQGRDADSSLDAIYEKRRSDPDRRLVYCGFGAWHKGDDRTFIRQVVAIGERRPEWDLVIGLGSRIDPADLGAVPDNVHLLPWAPQMQILQHADAAVHHGGISSVNECILNGVPMVLYPFDFLDQPGNAARVVFHGLGVTGSRDDTSAGIEARIETVLAGAGFRDAAAAMQGEFARLKGEPVRAVESLLGS